MNQVVTIVANPRSNSFTRRLLQAFSAAYQRRNPADMITELDVYDSEIPVIDDAVKKLFDVPASWKLIAQMPFGGIIAEPDAKEKEDISVRVKVHE